MYLKKLHISNFRCFRDYTIEFAPGVTVLFGKNGSGKTTLIHAIHKALSFMMHTEIIKEKDPKSKKLKVVDVLSIRKNNPFAKVEGYSKLGDVAYEKAKRGDMTIDIQADAELDGIPLSWAMSAYAINCRLRYSEYKEAFHIFYDWHKATGKFPLLAYYSDGYPHLNDFGKLTAGERKKALFMAKNDFPDIGYTDWNSDEGCTKMWIERLEAKMRNVELLFRRIVFFQTEQAKKAKGEAVPASGISKELYEKSLQELPVLQKEIYAVTDALKAFFSTDLNIKIDAIELSPYDSYLSVVTNTGKRYGFRRLPAGYKRLYYIVLDIAYRSYLLNGTTDAHGVVIIDEIDLHLHPELEQVVLQRFINTFPHIQFIVSTHSPLVLTGVETNKNLNVVLKMTLPDNAPEVWPNIHGIDYNQMLEENMGVSKRKPEIEALFEKAWKAVAAKDTEAAKKTVAELETVTPQDQTELVKLRAVISRIEIIGR